MFEYSILYRIGEILVKARMLPTTIILILTLYSMYVYIYEKELKASLEISNNFTYIDNTTEIPIYL